MATVAVVSAPQELQPGEGVEAARLLRARKWARVREGLFALAFYGAIAGAGALFPKARHLVWNVLWMGGMLGAVLVVKYLREFHPAVLPPVLENGSQLQTRLTRVRNWLAGTFLATMAMGFIAAFATSCSCENHPAMFIAWLVVFLGSSLGFLGVAAYLGLRTIEPQRRVGGSWPGAKRSISEYKAFHSEHWGNQGNAGARPLPAEMGR
jgi:hypothetical protein